MSEPHIRSMGPAEAADLLAPDGSEIRLLPKLDRGSMVHCRLPPGAVSRAIRHRTVEELWYVLAGEGELWRAVGDVERVVALRPHTAHTIPCGVRFQFRNTGLSPLDIVIVTMPPWPGEEEAEYVPGIWEPNVDTPGAGS